MDSIMVAIIGKDADAEDVLLSGLREFPARKAILVFDTPFKAKAQKISKTLGKMKMPIEFLEAKTDNFEDVFRAVAQIRASNAESKVIINTGTDYGSNCIALSAAFVNGVQAIGVMEGKIVAYPIMKFSYFSALSGKKTEVLRKIYDKREYDSLESLSKDLSMSLPLVTYHIRGSRDKKGLEQLGLVSTRRHEGKVAVKLTTLGNMIAKGYVDTPAEEEVKKRK